MCIRARRKIAGAFREAREIESSDRVYFTMRNNLDDIITSSDSIY